MLKIAETPANKLRVEKREEEHDWTPSALGSLRQVYSGGEGGVGVRGVGGGGGGGEG